MTVLNWELIEKVLNNKQEAPTHISRLVGKENVSFWGNFYELHRGKLAFLLEALTLEIRERKTLT